MLKIEDAVAVVTGGGDGIGMALAKYWVEPAEVVSLVGEHYRNEACAGDVYFIHGGLRLGSKGSLWRPWEKGST